MVSKHRRYNRGSLKESVAEACAISDPDWVAVLLFLRLFTEVPADCFNEV